MPYTRAWSNTIPAGTRAAGEIDDAIRELRVDIQQRMDEALVDDWFDDPVVAKSGVGGTVTNRVLVIPPHILMSVGGLTSVEANASISGSVVVSDQAFGGFAIPAGYVVKLFEVGYNGLTVSTLTISLRAVDLAGGVVSTLWSGSVLVDATNRVAVSSSINYTVPNNVYMQVHTDATDVFGGSFNYHIHGFRITIDKPNNSLGY